MQNKLGQRYQDFEQAFFSLLKKAKREPVSFHTFLMALSGRGKVLLLIFLSLGFSQIPVIAIVLGVFICYLGIRIAIGKSGVWMPKFLVHKTIAPYFLIKVIQATIRMLKFVKSWSWARYEWIVQKKATRIVNGSMIALVGLCLAISPPVPLTGSLAGLAIFLIGIGILNEDLVYLVLGYVSALCYLILVLLLLNYFSFTKIFHWFKNLFS